MKSNDFSYCAINFVKNPLFIIGLIVWNCLKFIHWWKFQDHWNDLTIYMIMDFLQPHCIPAGLHENRTSPLLFSRMEYYLAEGWVLAGIPLTFHKSVIIESLKNKLNTSQGWNLCVLHYLIIRGQNFQLL